MIAAAPLFLRKFLWLCILCTVLVVSIIIIPKIPTPRPAVDSKILALQVMLGVIGVLGALNLPILLRRAWTSVDGIFLALVSAFVLSALFSGRLAYCIAFSWHQLGLIILSWIIYRLGPEVAEIRALLWIAGAVALLASLYGFLTYIGLDVLKPLYPFSFDENQGGRNFIHSFYGNPEYYAGYAAPGAVVLFGLGFQRCQMLLRNRLVYLAAGAAVVLVVILSSSRMAFVGFTAGVLMVALGQVRHSSAMVKRISVVIGAVGLLTVAAGLFILSTPNPLNPRDMRLLQRFGDVTELHSDSVRERVIFYSSTAAAIPGNPIFGAGPGAFRLEFLNNVKLLANELGSGESLAMLGDINRRLAEHAHNDYLEMWFDQGILGFGALLMLMVFGGVRFVKNRGLMRAGGWVDCGAADCHLIIFAALTTMFINALTSFPLQMPARATLVWVLTGSFFALDYAVGEACRRGVGSTNKIYD